MSLNEVIIFAVLVTLGAGSGAVFGCRAANRGNDFAPAMLKALSFGIAIPLLVLFLIAVFEVFPNSSGILKPALAALGIAFFYGIGETLVSAPSALLACWIAFRARS